MALRLPDRDLNDRPHGRGLCTKLCCTQPRLLCPTLKLKPRSSLYERTVYPQLAGKGRGRRGGIWVRQNKNQQIISERASLLFASNPSGKTWWIACFTTSTTDLKNISPPPLPLHPQACTGGGERQSGTENAVSPRVGQRKRDGGCFPTSA